MKHTRPTILGTIALLGLFALPFAASAVPVTVISEGRTHSVDAEHEGESLWLSETDLKKITGFDIKPEGACRNELCIPLGQGGDKLTRKSDGGKRCDLLGLAKAIHQPVAADTEAKVWSLGPVPAVVASGLQEGIAPDFELADAQGKTHKLSDYRGKKVLVLTWASWCGCSMDLPGWEKIREELKDKNFEIIAAAQDTAGFAAAGRHYDKAKATFPALVDPYHTVSTLYQMVNVPMGVWIDEEGRIVRPTEVAYSTNVKLGDIAVNGDDYVAGLRDWVEKGAKSPYVMRKSELREKERPRDEKLGLADAHFKLAVHFRLSGDEGRAGEHFKAAQELNPDCWNYHRQEWSFTPRIAMKNWSAKVKALDGKPYYEPLELPKGETTAE